MDTEPRYERKLIFPAALSWRLYGELKNNNENLARHHPTRRINNIYYELPNFQSYNDNVVGVPYRSKLRLRWYGEHISKKASPVLEMKLKNGHVGTKKRFEIQTMPQSGGFEINEILANNPALKPTDFIDFSVARPLIYNTYVRDYYRVPCTQVRVTVDHGLGYGIITPNILSTRKVTVEDERIIIEVKHHEKEEDIARNVLNSFSVRVAKMSKYVNGVNMLFHDFKDA